jgi:hypothetical protein
MNSDITLLDEDEMLYYDKTAGEYCFENKNGDYVLKITVEELSDGSECYLYIVDNNDDLIKYYENKINIFDFIKKSKATYEVYINIFNAIESYKLLSSEEILNEYYYLKECFYWLDTPHSIIEEIKSKKR